MTNSIKPLTIGNLTFSNNLIQGPLAGISCAAFRALCYRFTPPAYCVTEMISAKHLIKNPTAQHRYLYRHPSEQRLCYQLSGNCANTLAEACQVVTDLGADLIDLNCGCPKRKIRQKGCGSKHLEKPQLLAQLVEAMRKATHLPLTVKIRMCDTVGTHNTVILAKTLENAGADALIIHGRHWTQDYNSACRYEDIRVITSCVAIPVICNGDIENYCSLQQAMQTTHCAGAMISRAGTGRPWLFAKLIAQSLGQDYPTATQQQQKDLLAQHIEILQQLCGAQQAELQSRSFKKYYLTA